MESISFVLLSSLLSYEVIYIQRMAHQTIDSYISAFPLDVQKVLEQVRNAIQSVAPQATEKMAYGIPTFYWKGNLVHFAGYKSHIGFYPAPSGIAAFEKELKNYKHAKGSVQFPIDQVPYDLIQKITRFRLDENQSLDG